MKKIIPIIFISIHCFAQTNDSLLYQLKSIINDTERVNQIYKAGFELRNSDPELAYKYATTCKTEALKSNSDKHLAKSYNLLGVLFYKKGDYVLAIQYQKKALELNQKINYAIGIAINQVNLGNIYTDLNYYSQAESSYLQALKTYNALNSKLQITRCLINIGTLKSTKKQYSAAISQYKEALVYANDIGDLELISDCNNNIGDNLININQLDTALLYLEEGLKIRDMIDNEYEKANSYNNLARLFIKKQNFEQAQNYMNLSGINCIKANNTDATIELYAMRALYFESQKQFESALLWTKKNTQLKDSIMQLDKENGQFIYLDENNEALKSNNINTLQTILFVIIAILSTIILLLFFKRKTK